MSATSYTWDNAMVEGRRRLALLEHTLDPSTFRRLESIGVRAGWHCLDVGAGGGTVCDWLCARVGATGRVVGMDMDARFLRALHHPNLEVREENGAAVDLPEQAFDLEHTRWTLLHIPEREAVLRKLVAALKPGGILFLEEPDGYPVILLDRTGWGDLTRRILELVKHRGSDGGWARHLPYEIAPLGFGDVRVEGETPYFHGRSELAEFWKISWTRVRDGVAATGADVSQWDRELAELDDPGKLFVGPMTLGVIATKR